MRELEAKRFKNRSPDTSGRSGRLMKSWLRLVGALPRGSMAGQNHTVGVAIAVLRCDETKWGSEGTYGCVQR
jgi:hypothetical protein